MQVTDGVEGSVKGEASEVLILAHGLQGTVEDFNYLLDRLHAAERVKRGELQIHASRVNTDRTHDGIVLGGLRLAEDIRAVVTQTPSLRAISIIGFSLGGIYVRYALGHLYKNGRICGLQARSVVIVASPNLGVREYGLFRFIPVGLAQMCGGMIGQTVRELFMIDEDAILDQMSRDGEVPFLSALKCFETRYLYANVRSDLMVNYGTAALDPSIRGVGGHEIDRFARGMEGCVDEEYDGRGCKLHVFDREVGDGGDMCERLKSVGWKVVAVDFVGATGIAHNRIVAMSRNGVHAWLNAAGKRVVLHLVDTVVGEEGQGGFRRVVSAR